MKIIKYKQFESVYLFNTSIEDYKVIGDGYGNLRMLLDLKGSKKLEFSVVHYGDKNTEYRFQQNTGDVLNEDELIQVAKDLIYIFNKNRLGYEMSLEKLHFDSHITPYYIVKVEPAIDAEKFERVWNTTKMINAKVKDMDLDKLAYLTGKNK